MTQISPELERILFASSVSEKIRREMLADPKKVIRSFGIDIPDTVNIRVVEDDPNTVTIALPPFIGRPTDPNQPNLLELPTWTACTACGITTPICTLGTWTSVIIAVNNNP